MTERKENRANSLRLLQGRPLGLENTERQNAGKQTEAQGESSLICITGTSKQTSAVDMVPLTKDL